MRRLGGIGEAFSDRNFRIYSIGAIASWITYFIQMVAFSWAAWEVTHSTTWLAVISILGVVAILVLMPIGGVLADRHDRFRMVLIAYALDAVQAAVLAVLAFTDQLGLPALLISSFLHGAIHSFSVPASYCLMPRFVARERLASAIAVGASYSQFAIFAGPAIAGWILVHWGVAAAFAVNVVGYLVYFCCAAFLRTPVDFVQAKSGKGSLFTDLLDGGRYIFQHESLKVLLLLVLVGDAVSTAVVQMVPAYSDLILGMGVGGASVLYGAMGLGATAAALWLAHGGARRTTLRNITWAVAGISAAVALLAGAPGLIVAGAAMALLGFSGETRRTATVAMMQSTVDDLQRGRVMSSLFMFTQVAGGIGTLAIGIVAGTTNMRVPMAVSALVLALVWLLLLRGRKAEVPGLGPIDRV
ncbi:MAG: hypothetical protein RLZZ444_413 [Pseudomonadota bacterium]